VKLREYIAALLGFSAYTPPELPAASLEDQGVTRIRRALGGQLSPLPLTQTRWYLADLERAQHLADTGDLSMAARLCRAMRRDGIIAGVLATRANGIVALPKRFDGDEEMVRALEGRDGARGVFDAMCPASELVAFAIDGVQLGVSLAELVPVEGRTYPILVRLDPEFLRYRWSENRWYYSSIAGLIPITPGDGRWVLHIDGGRIAPWQFGLWMALGEAFINKSHAKMHQANWEAKLANPARVAVAPQGASEAQKQSWFQKVMAWGVNTVFGMTPGYDVKLLESNGTGWESFDKTISRSERESIIAVTGSTVLVDGGTGFANADVHKSIRADLIESTARALEHTINSQVIPQWVAQQYGEDALDKAPAVAWDTTPPKDQKSDADAMQAFGKAIAESNSSLAPYGKRIAAREFALRFGIPLEDAPKVTEMALPALPAANDVVDVEEAAE
jgi:Protein of unknown function (DUF935)